MNLDRTKSVEDLVNDIHSEDEKTRLMAYALLGEKDDPRAIEGLLAALETEQPPLKSIVVLGLRGYTDERHIEPLCKYLQDEDKMTVCNTIEALSLIMRRTKSYNPVVIKLILNKLYDDDNNIKSQVLDALGRIGEVAIPYLGPFIYNHDNYIRAWTVLILSYIGTEEAEAIIVKMLKDRSARVRQTAAKILGYMLRPNVIPFLLEARNDEDPDVREAANHSLELLRGRE